jgi:hypothetical protein
MSASTSFAHRRRLADYLSACANEIAIDAASMKLARKVPAELGYFPRPAKWLALAQIHKGFWTRTASPLAEALWRWGGCAVTFSLQWVQLRRALGRHAGEAVSGGAAHQTGPQTQLPPLGRYLLVFSTRAGEVVPPAGMAQPPAVWITLPWVPAPKPPPGVVPHDVMSLLTSADLRAAWADAISVTRVFSRRPALRRWVLQTYTAFRWFAVRRGLEKLHGAFITAEHFDRWAVLADSAALHLRKTGPHQDLGPTAAGWLEVVQHGTIGSLAAADPSAALCFPRRLRAVCALYVYDAASEVAFKRDVLSPGCVRRGPQVHHFRPTIALQPTPQRGACRVLFVGHPLCEALHLHLLAAVSRSGAIDAYYKPHPTAKMSEALVSQAWTVITERNHFPEVDLLVSYPSTLVVEYGNADVPAVVHGMDESAETSGASLAALQQKIASLLAHAGGPIPARAETPN